METLISEVNHRWRSGDYIEEGVPLPESTFPDLPWVPYEEYMRARLVHATEGELGDLIIEFPSDSAEDNKMHIHPKSDRIILVVQGDGTFVAERLGQRVTHTLRLGTRVWMPRGIVHTFYSGPNGLLVRAQHLPWVPIEDPECLVYP